jgi:erythromycin esterase
MLSTKKRSFEDEVIRSVGDHAYPLDAGEDLNPLIDRIGDARIVMLGEASHGTHEYYTWRSLITKRLIREKQFNFIAVEGDWPDAYCLNRYIKNYTDAGGKATDILRTFDRWPTWMWANWETAALAEWLRSYNMPQPKEKKIGFYGLDIYSLWESLEAIRKYLAKADPSALEAAEKAFRCFEPYRTDDGSSYAYASTMVPKLCEKDVLELLIKIQQRLPAYDSDYENVFSTEQNALIAVNAEKYYRSMMKGSAESWNIRDAHMQETLERLLDFHGSDSKVIVWEHNTHIGDASATDMAAEGMFNIGQLARKKYSKKEVVLVGFGSYKGTVIAGKKWGDDMRKMKMPDARDGSWEHLLHEAGDHNKLLIMEELQSPGLNKKYLGHRAIGVVYNPEFEMYGNYVPSIMPRRYDAFIFLDETHGLHPIHLQPDGHLVPETYPFGV